MKNWERKAKHSYLSVNKTSPGNLRNKMFHNFFYGNKLCGLQS